VYHATVLTCETTNCMKIVENNNGNPWRLQAWLGHSTINMTMRYVHHVEKHHRPVPATILAAGATVMDPDARVIAMLRGRSGSVRGSAVANDQRAVSST
jgi:hypothetical protein